MASDFSLPSQHKCAEKSQELPAAIDFNYLLWQCRRGMLELDEILVRFLRLNYHGWTIPQQQIFSYLLQQTDADLFDWLLGKALPRDPNLKNLILLIRDKS